MKAKLGGIFSLLLIVLSLALTPVLAESVVPVMIVQAEIDDTEIDPFGWTELDILRESEFELDLELESYADAKDIEIRAFVSGFEYNDIEPISARIGPFDFEEGVTYKRKMSLTLPADLETDDYKLRLILSDRDGIQLDYWYQLHVDTERHKLVIEDAVFADKVKAGSALVGFVRIENEGQRDQKDVRVEVSIPSLGLKDVKYIEEIEAGDEEETEEFFIRLPKDAEAGVHELVTKLEFSKRHKSVVQKSTVEVLQEPKAEPVVVIEPTQNETVAAEPAPAKETTSKSVRSALEIILLVLVALLVVIGLIIGFSRLRQDE